MNSSDPQIQIKSSSSFDGLLMSPKNSRRISLLILPRNPAQPSGGLLKMYFTSNLFMEKSIKKRNFMLLYISMIDLQYGIAELIDKHQATLYHWETKQKRM